MSQSKQTRRQFMQTAAAATASLAGAATAITPYWITSSAARAQEQSKNDRHTIGCIGTGDRWTGAIGPQVKKFGDIVAVCDVDKNHVERNGQRVAGGKADMYEDYRKVLDRKDIDVVTIVTPDHWHSKIAIEAMQAGKDVYCEKPLTLTIDEGKKICQVQKQTNRVFQVGTQQRDEFNANANKFKNQFLQVVALAHAGKFGKINRISCAIGRTDPCPVLPKVPVPDGLNWEMWQGQTPLVDFVQGGTSPSNNRYPAGRTHYEFRWWYEYSGGKLTDWGAHHVDIAQWALGMDHSGPTSISGTGEFPVVFEKGMPTVDNMYNTAKDFNITCKFANGAEIVIRPTIENHRGEGMFIEGEDAAVMVSRGELKDVRGTVIAELAEKPIEEDVLMKLCKGKKPGDHMRNFIECVKDRSLPISDVFTHHRAVSTCHLANIAIRLGRPIQWDPEKEEIVGDKEANGFLVREQRKGYEIKV
ncbi:MAG TPA: Gfo/Idh/MocA family oxidoreductase [Pirellulales bacterium]|jgi:predicted dehydrogenase